MKHLIICREYPPAPSGGIGTYVYNIANLLAECGEKVHVIGQLWEGATNEIEEMYNGRLVIHRVPFIDWTSFFGLKPCRYIKSNKIKGLFDSEYFPQCFSWQACMVAESLIENEGIDVIEAQDYEAPLYYFQLRRALGLGPKEMPPCIVHLHSPTEFIVKHNEFDATNVYYRTAKRLEDYSIAAADSLLCPSQFLSRQLEEHYALPINTINVIPYPACDFKKIDRTKETWENGTICYIGRLERRKGVLEWIDAAIKVANDIPNAKFEFIGEDVHEPNGLSVETQILYRIPNNLKRRFIIRGGQPRYSLNNYLAKARIAVIPSRWENFPNTCIEAMCSGLPVIASGNGGMIEMIRDGYSGWIAKRDGSAGLEEALRRALLNSPFKLAEMGNNASSEIMKICDSKEVLERQLKFRSKVVNKGAMISLDLPINLPSATQPLGSRIKRRVPKNEYNQGIAIIISTNGTGQFLHNCLQNIERQKERPETVVIVNTGSSYEATVKALNEATRRGFKVIYRNKDDETSDIKTGMEWVLSSGIKPIGFSHLRVTDLIHRDFVAFCQYVLTRCPEVGLISSWSRIRGDKNKIWLKPSPSLPYQFANNDAGSFSVIRSEAIIEAYNSHKVKNSKNEVWDIFNSIMTSGWVAVTVPEVLIEQELEHGSTRVLKSSLQQKLSSLRLFLYMMGAMQRHPSNTMTKVLKKIKNKIYLKFN